MAPVADYDNVEPDTIRVDTYNKVIDKSNIHAIRDAKKDELEAKMRQKEEIRLRKEHKAKQKAEQLKIENFLEMSGLVRCKCKKKCTKRCACYIENQRCIYLFPRPCEGKNESKNNQFNEEQLLNTVQE